MALIEVAAGATALWAVTRRIVNRPRPTGSVDLREVDDALRGHSLTILAGSAIALASWPLAQFAVLVAEHNADAAAATLLGNMIPVAGLVLGFEVASLSASARARTRRSDARA